MFLVLNPFYIHKILENCQYQGSKYWFSKIPIFASKLEFYHWSQIPFVFLKVTWSFHSFSRCLLNTRLNNPQLACHSLKNAPWVKKKVKLTVQIITNSFSGNSAVLPILPHRILKRCLHKGILQL